MTTNLTPSLNASCCKLVILRPPRLPLPKLITVIMSLNGYEIVASGLNAGKYHPRLSSAKFASLPWHSVITKGSLRDLVNQRDGLSNLKVGHIMNI